MALANVAAITHVGLVRSENEDSWAVLPGADGPWDAVLLIADGMGGHAAGKEASERAVAAMSAYLLAELTSWPETEADLEKLLREGFVSVNEEVKRTVAGVLGEATPGTTLTVALLHDSDLYWAHVGDTRLYLLTPAGLEQLTEDQTWARHQVASGVLTAEQAQRSPQRHHLLQAVGTDEELFPEWGAATVESGDVVLLTTDGITDAVTDSELAAALSEESTLEDALEQIVALGLDRGGEDNLTAVAGHLEGSGSPENTAVSAGPRPSHAKTRSWRNPEHAVVGLFVLLLLVIAAVLSTEIWWPSGSGTAGSSPVVGGQPNAPGQGPAPTAILLWRQDDRLYLEPSEEGATSLEGLTSTALHSRVFTTDTGVAFELTSEERQALVEGEAYIHLELLGDHDLVPEVDFHDRPVTFQLVPATRAQFTFVRGEEHRLLLSAQLHLSGTERLYVTD